MLGTEGEVTRAAEWRLRGRVEHRERDVLAALRMCERVLDPRVELLPVRRRIDRHERPVHVLAGLKQALLVRAVERIQHDELPVQSYGDVPRTPGYPRRMRFVVLTMLALALVASATATPEAKRRPAPAIAGMTLDGKQVSLTKLRGKPVFINVWSSW